MPGAVKLNRKAVLIAAAIIIVLIIVVLSLRGARDGADAPAVQTTQGAIVAPPGQTAYNAECLRMDGTVVLGVVMLAAEEDPAALETIPVTNRNNGNITTLARAEARCSFTAQP